MSANSSRGRREFIALISAAVLIQVLIGALATSRGHSVAWGSLVHRPLFLAALSFAALTTKRLGYLLLIAWVSFLAVMYAYGGFAASYTALRSMRWMAAAFFAWSAVRLMTSVYIRAYRSERQLDS